MFSIHIYLLLFSGIKFILLLHWFIAIPASMAIFLVKVISSGDYILVQERLGEVTACGSCTWREGVAACWKNLQKDQETGSNDYFAVFYFSCCCFVLFKRISPFPKRVMSYLYHSEDCDNEWVSLIWWSWFEIPSLKTKTTLGSDRFFVFP